MLQKKAHSDGYWTIQPPKIVLQQNQMSELRPIYQQ